MRDDELALQSVALAEGLAVAALAQGVERGVGARRKKDDFGGIDSLLYDSLAHAFGDGGDQRGALVGEALDAIERVDQRLPLHHAEFDGGVGLQVHHVKDKGNAPQAAEGGGGQGKSERRRDGIDEVGALAGERARKGRRQDTRPRAGCVFCC